MRFLLRSSTILLRVPQAVSDHARLHCSTSAAPLFEFEGSTRSPPQPPLKYATFPAISRPSNPSPQESYYLSPKIARNPPTTFALARVSSILGKKNWSLALSEELRSGLGSCLDPQFVIRVLRDQKDPVLSLKFFAWISRVGYGVGKDRAVVGVLLDLLCWKGPVVLSAELLEDLRSSGCGITEDLICVLISSWGKLGLANYVSEVFGRLAVLGLRPTILIYNSVIDALVKSKSLDLAYFKFQQMPSDGCCPNRFTYNILIHGVCKFGIIEEALRLLKQMERSGHSPNVNTYTILVDGFCNAKNVEGAFHVLEMMRKRGVVPSGATYRSLIHGAFRVLNPCVAYSLTSRLLEQDGLFIGGACNVILYCISKNNLAWEAREFLGKMMQKGYSLDAESFNLVMACFLRTVNLSETCCLFDDFVARGGKPGFDAYYMLMTALCAEGRVEDAEQYVNRMQSDGLICSVVSYNMLIDAFCKAQRMEKAVDTFQQMLEKGFSPTIVSFNTLVSGYARYGRNDKVRETLKLMFQHGIQPDVHTFSSTISGLYRACQIDDALSCYHEMVEWGVPPNAVIYNLLIRFCCSFGKESEATKLFFKMKSDRINPDSYSYNALILNFCKMKEIEMAQNLLESMLKSGVLPDIFTYNTFIKALCDVHEVGKAAEIIKAMKTNGCLPNSYSYKPIVDAFLAVGQQKVAEQFINQCLKRGIPLELHSVGKLCKACE